MDLTVALFLDCGEEAITAGLVSDRYNITLKAADVHAIRVDAAMAASALKPSDARKRWTYRFCELTLDNLIKEYMFITRVPTFMEAKIDLADEVFWLSEKSNKSRLCIAFNDALGRNNLTMALLDELLAFREGLLRVKAMVSRASDGSGSPLFLLDVAEQTAAHASQPGANPSESAAFLGWLLGIKEGEATYADVRFLCQYHEGANLPDLTDPDGFQRLFEAADTRRERLVQREATDGNLANLTRDELQQLFDLLRTRPLLGKAPLAGMLSVVARKFARDRSDELLHKLNNLLEGQVMVSDVENLYTRPERFKMGLRGLPAENVAALLNKANALTVREEIRAVFRNAAVNEATTGMLAELTTRYMSKRFG